MTSPRRSLALLGAIFVLPVGLSACGGGGSVPSDAVVKIGSDTISKTALDHFMAVSAKQQAQQSGAKGAAAAVPDPPSFTKCIAAKQQAAAKPAKGQPAPTEATYKAQCQQQYAALRDQAMQFLISSAWVEGESADQGVTIPDADVKKAFDRQRMRSLPDDKSFESFLKKTGYSQEDLLYQIKIQELSRKVRAKVLVGSDKVSAAQVAAYYAKNKDQLGDPEKRDLRIVLTKTEDKAKQAKAALDAGQSWSAVASEYSIDQGTREKGGVAGAIPKGQLEKALDDAVFSARKGEVAGPVKIQSGYIVFEVDKVTAGRPQSLKQSEASIKQQLINQQQQTKFQAFTKDFEKKWRNRTECQKGYAMQSCKNAPRAQPAPAAPAAPAGAATTGAGASSGGATTNK